MVTEDDFPGDWFCRYCGQQVEALDTSHGDARHRTKDPPNWCVREATIKKHGMKVKRWKGR